MSEAPTELHLHPPTTIARFRQRHPWLLLAALVFLVLLGFLALIQHGALLVWDQPITDAAVDHRSSGVDRLALWISRLGSTPVVLAAGAAGVAVAWRRCRAVATVMLLTVAARPALEWVLKDLVERPRPSGARMVPGTGFSFPSGHVLAAAATWGFVPLLAALYIRRRWLWWLLTSAAVTLIVAMAWSRVWLGVHFTSDVVASLALSFVGLTAAERAVDALHRRWSPPHYSWGAPNTSVSTSAITGSSTSSSQVIEIGASASSSP